MKWCYAFVAAIVMTLTVSAAAADSSLEQQIAELEQQLRIATAPDPTAVPADLKEQLNALYAQRPENQPRDPGNPLDQGSETCPGPWVSVNTTVTGTTAGYQNNYVPITDCNPPGGGSGPDVVYRFSTWVTYQRYTISLCGSSYDTYLYVVSDDCGFSQWACNDDNALCGLQSMVSFERAGAQVYTIFVDGWGSSSMGDYVLTVTNQGMDACPGTPITHVPFNDEGTTAGYANDYAPVYPCGFSAAPDVVYSFVAPSTRNYRVSLCGSSYDTYLYVVEGNCTLSQIACNDDHCGLQSEVVFPAVAGQRYTIFVDGYGGSSGFYDFSITDACPPAHYVVLKPSSSPSQILMSLWAPAAGTYDVYATTNMTGEYPTGYSLLGTLNLFAGQNDNLAVNVGAAAYRRLVVVHRC